MYKLWLQLLVAVATIVSAVISIAILFNNAVKFAGKLGEREATERKTIHRYFSAIDSTYRAQIRLVVVVIVGAIILILIACFTSCDIPAENPPAIETPSSGTVITAPVSSTTSLPQIFMTKSLCELDPIIERHDSFFYKSWNSFDDFVIGSDTIACGIGIDMPSKKLAEYVQNSHSRRITHSEYIEYSLGYDYQFLAFDYGIDDSSFPQLIGKPPACMCRITISSVPSGHFGTDAHDSLFDSGWFNYRLSRRSASVNLVEVETIRITVEWELDTNSANASSLRILLIDPLLHYFDQDA